jgi:hypothetical protein
MTNYKYKIAEVKETLKPTEVDPALIQRIEKTYGPVDMENDFFSANLKTYFKTSSIDTETGSIGHKIIKLASFTDSLEKLYIATNALSDLVKSPGGKDDAVVVRLYDSLKTVFNSFRTHLRKYYPDQYAAIKDKLDEISSVSSNSGFISGGEGENHNGPRPKKEAFRASQFAFGKQKKSNYDAYAQVGYEKVSEGPGATFGPGPSAGPEGVTKNKYVTDFKYKLVGKAGAQRAAQGLPAKQIKEEDTNVEQYLQDISVSNPDNKKFIASRLMGFDELERKLNQLLPLLQQAKHETMDYYRQKPESFGIVYGTDLANDYLNDLIELFKK